MCLAAFLMKVVTRELKGQAELVKDQVTRLDYFKSNKLTTFRWITIISQFLIQSMSIKGHL